MCYFRITVIALLSFACPTGVQATEDVVFPNQYKTESQRVFSGKCDGGKSTFAVYEHESYRIVELVTHSHNRYFLLLAGGKSHAFLWYSWWEKNLIPEEWITSGWIANLKDESPNFLRLILKKGATDFYNNYLQNLVEIPTAAQFNTKANSDCRLIR